MTNNGVIIDYTQCRYNTYDGGGSQRTICSLDGKYCDCLRDKDCYYKQLQRKTTECEKLKEELENAKYSSKMWQEQADKRNEISKIWFKKAAKYKSALEETIKVLQRCVDCASENHYSCGTCGRYDLLQKIKKIAKEQE